MEPTEKSPEQALKAARKAAIKTLASELGETEAGPRQQLAMVVKQLGPEQALAFLHEAQAIEANGGLMLPDGSRRRTPGGVFFYLVRTKGPPAVQGLWGRKSKHPKPEGHQTVSPQAATPAAQHPFPPPLPTMTWEDRLIVLQELATEKGTVRTVKITLIGRPGNIVDKGSCVVTMMQASKAPALPKGLPVPSAPPTNYVVYITAKQWKAVAEAIKDPEDVLIVEGYPQLDPKTVSLAVFATNTTTKKLQAARRQPPAKSETE
jgi:hypothetical protein